MEFIFTVTVGKKEFEDFNAAFSGIDAGILSAMDQAASGIRAALMSSLREVTAKMAERHGEQWAGMPDGSQANLFSKTGSGLRSILESPVVLGGPGIDGITGIVSAADMSWHENAANPTPKKAKYMTIPLPAAMDSRGVPLYPSARAWFNTFIMRSKAGNLIIFQRRGREIVPLYLLKTTAPRPARLGMEEALMEQLPYFELKVIEQIDRALERWGR